MEQSNQKKCAIKVRVTEEEHSYIAHQSKELNYTISDYIRFKVFSSQQPNPLYTQSVKNFLDQLNSMRNSLYNYSKIAKSQNANQNDFQWDTFLSDFDKEVLKVWHTLNIVTENTQVQNHSKL